MPPGQQISIENDVHALYYTSFHLPQRPPLAAPRYWVQIGRFLKVLGKKFSYNSCPDIWRLLFLIPSPFSPKTTMTTFCAAFGGK